MRSGHVIKYQLRCLEQLLRQLRVRCFRRVFFALCDRHSNASFFPPVNRDKRLQARAQAVMRRSTSDATLVRVGGSRLDAWDSALLLDAPESHGAGVRSGLVLCRICERDISARNMAEHTRCCVLASQCSQEAAGCDSRLEALAAKLHSKIDERRQLAKATTTPFAEKLSLGASVLSALSQLWALAAFWAIAAIALLWYGQSWRGAGGGSSHPGSPVVGDRQRSHRLFPKGFGRRSPRSRSTPSGGNGKRTTAPTAAPTAARALAFGDAPGLIQPGPASVTSSEPPVPAPAEPVPVEPTLPKAVALDLAVLDPLSDTSILEEAAAALARLAHYEPGTDSAVSVSAAAARTLERVQSQLEVRDLPIYPPRWPSQATSHA